MLSMKFKFSLYGFLKNLRFFEPFFLLFLRDKGLSFTSIGFLLSFREIMINIMEIPSGIIADTFGRKNVMIISLVSYILSFSIFGASKSVILIYIAMFFFAIGESFRTGTHKAIIFNYLDNEGLLDKKIEFYGFTRSWSQKGSALSVVLATSILLIDGNYKSIFWWSIIPYVIGLINISSYPSYLNKVTRAKTINNFSFNTFLTHLKISISSIFKKSDLKYLLVNSMIFTGTFKSIKDYLQILIKSYVVTIPMSLIFSKNEEVILGIGTVYVLIYLISSIASKSSFKLVRSLGSKSKTIQFISITSIILMLTASISDFYSIKLVTISCFILLYLLQNIWRPIITGSIAENSDKELLATTLSIESQLSSLTIFILAPIIGLLMDGLGLYAVLAFMALIFTVILVMQIKILCEVKVK